MIPGFPRWVWFWALALPAIAGSVNACALLALRHGGVTHLTGVGTEASLGMTGGDTALMSHAVAVIALFIAGCALSGWAIRSERWRASGAVVVMLLLEGILLGLASSLLHAFPAAAMWLSALSIGLQNGTSSLVTGAVLRTSHLTGMFTDLGTSLGQRLRRAPHDVRRARVSITVIVSFLTGAAAGTAFYRMQPAWALGVPALMAFVTAIITFCYRLPRTLSEVNGTSTDPDRKRRPAACRG